MKLMEHEGHEEKIPYDVSFTDGSCVELFSGCDQAEDFFWQSLLSIEAANDALAAQVAQAVAGAETPSLSWQAQWDPELIGALISVAPGPIYEWFSVPSGASSSQGCNSDYLGNCIPPEEEECEPDEYWSGLYLVCVTRPVIYETTDAKYLVWSLLSPSEESPAAVTEPTTMLMLGSGLFGLVAFRKKFKK
ncbi:MAG: PEP-CTERM sorting domain-containing protein [Thermodesulfobacteriota bacterium]